MDLLGSILGNMDKPPSASNEQRKKVKANREKFEKLQDEERKMKAKFREDMEDRVSKLINDTEQTRLKFKPMDKIRRTILHDVAEIAGLIAQAFGKEEEGRYIVLFKKECPPSEEELASYRKGEEWDPEKEGVERKEEPESSNRTTTESSNQSKSVKVAFVEPVSDYRDKYRHLIGTSSAKDAARKTEANKSFGMVPSENKRDLRSIEETLNEIRKKKRQKTEEFEKDES